MENERPIPFEFLINGTFLRTTLEEYLTANGISSENVLNVEYVRATIPPQHLASIEEDDWISSVDILSSTSPAGQWSQFSPQNLGSELILTGNYDGRLRVWSTSLQLLAISTSKSSHYLKQFQDVKWISPTQIASSGMDGVVRLWEYVEKSDAQDAALKPTLELYGHKDGLGRIAVHQPSSRILSASDDHTVGIWSMRKSDAPAAPPTLLPQAHPGPANKKRKLSGTSTPQRGPLAILKSHTQQVSSTVFKPDDPTVGYSVSWDHTLKTWDLTTASLVDTRTISHSIFALTALSDLNLVAVGTVGCYIALIDPRASATTVSAMTLRGHTNIVKALDRDPNNRFGLVSGSYDSTCKIWDVRSGKSGKEGMVGQSTFTIRRESTKGQTWEQGDEMKVFGVRWDKEVGVVSVGKDKMVQIDRAQ